MSRAGTILHSVRAALDANQGWRGGLLCAACLTLPLLLFLGIAFGNPAKTLVAAIYYRDPILVMLILAALAGGYHLRGWLGVGAALAATLFLFAVELAGSWTSAASTEFAVGGWLPWSDAGGYYRGAELLSEGLDLQTWHGRRPLFIAELAVLLELTAHHLRAAIGALVLITAVACFLLARQMRASLGAAAAAIVVLFVWTFYSPLVNSTMSEHLGLSLGALAMTALWGGSQAVRPNALWFIGLWLLTVALAARAGAFLVLPALLCWAFVQGYRNGSVREALWVSTLGLAAICAGFAVDAAVRAILVPEAMPFGNFSRTLYGVVVGNKGWLQIARDHPELAQLGDSEANRTVYQLALQAAGERPGVALGGLLSAWRDYFTFGSGAFCFVTSPPLQIGCIVLVVLGSCRALLRWRDPRSSMVLAMAAGVLLSVPFVPPLDSGCMRVHAATIPSLGLLLALGAASPWGQSLEQSGNTFRLIAPALGVALILVSAGGATFLHLSREPSQIRPLACPPGQEPLVMRLREGNEIRFVAASSRNDPPELSISDFQNRMGIHRRFYPELHRILMGLNAEDELRRGIDLTEGRQGRPVWLVTRGTPSLGLMRACSELVGTADHHCFYRAMNLPEAGVKN